MLAEVNWIFAIPASIFGTICFTLPLVLCVCGCKTKELKDDFIGVEGRVKITNPEEYEREVNDNNITSDVADKINTAKRSLPDLPVDLNATGRNDICWEPNGDTTSELYATVVVHDEKNEKHRRQKSGSSSISPSLTYSNVKEDHQYDRLQKFENPYAQVTGNGKKEAVLTSFVNINSESKIINSEENPVELFNSSVPPHESSGNIPAANAIAGHVMANDDLPYMTPPAHFSGDSQDSGKGYTSISVREPLSTIQAETKANKNFKLDSHYSTVSDDSDDMYAAIDDPNQVYVSESETYEQIHPESNILKSVPQPPSVDSLKQMTNFSHSRQASSSSLVTPIPVSSSKEKRQTSSNLPPTPNKSPVLTEDLYSTIDKNLREEPFPIALEDMYAKVNKKTRREIELLERNDSTESGVSESSDSMSYKLQSTTTAESSRSCHSYLSKSTLTDTPSSPTNRRGETSCSSDTDSHSNYEKLGVSPLRYDGRFDPGYETVNKGPSEIDPEYEKLKPNKQDNTERGKIKNLNFVNVDQIESDVSDDYTTVKPDFRENEIYSKINVSDSDGYARVQLNESTNSEGYAKVLKFYKDKPEPNYEKVLFSDAQGVKFAERLTEPTYESLNNEFEGEESNDPNYESVRFHQHSITAEPPYQLLRECESGATDN